MDEGGYKIRKQSAIHFITFAVKKNFSNFQTSDGNKEWFGLGLLSRRVSSGSDLNF